MDRIKNIFRNRILPLIYFDTFGNIAIASLIICSVSGILLALVYNVSEPYESISKILMVSSSGTFYRNLHYWSAQLFLIFTFLHIWDHFKKNTEGKVKSGVWLRLTISIGVVLFVMLSGFILKGDADSRQAYRIIESLLKTIPIFGDALSSTLLGSEDNYQLLYVHHIATATIFLIIITYEHARTIWTKIPTFIYTLFYSFVLSLFFTPVLHDNLETVIKGPWYFLGLQEILHWISNPVYTIAGLFLLFLLFLFIPKVRELHRNRIKNLFIYSTLVYLLLTIFAYYFRGENWELVTPWDNPKTNYLSTGLIDTDKSFPSDTSQVFHKSLNRVEGCISCHDNMTGFTASHDPSAVGCSSCHSGNPFSFNKDEAHLGMILIPGNEADYRRSCGTSDCHPEIVERLPNSIMSTLSGMISVNKFAFAEIKLPEGHYNVNELADSPAESHLRNLCVSCHIGNPKTELGPIDQLSRGGGCNACHLNYSESAKKQLAQYIATKSESTLPSFHPSLSLEISSNHCFGCHSRSGRISTNYEGWHETKLSPDEVDDSSGLRILQDERVFRFVKADVHHEAGMDCIDCHNSYEVMGDGTLYSHKEEQVKIQCIDCHFSGRPESIKLAQFDSESAKIAKIREIDNQDRDYLVMKKSGYPLVNTFVDSIAKSRLIIKNTGKILDLNPPKPVCFEREAHKDLSCSSCHTSWVPQCVGCHTDFDPQAEGFDLLTNKDIKGSWIEHVGDYFAELPTLGVTESTDSSGIKSRSINTFMPGMVMSIDKSGYTGNIKDALFTRLFAPTFSHTIRKEVRDCRSCHNNPLALGFGRGSLEFVFSEQNGYWKFTPKYENYEDGLPEDAWTGFLQEPTKLSATRSNSRPFSVEEQKNILTVGACLVCHDQDSQFAELSLVSFSSLIEKISTKCILPDWE